MLDKQQTSNEQLHAASFSQQKFLTLLLDSYNLVFFDKWKQLIDIAICTITESILPLSKYFAITQHCCQHSRMTDKSELSKQEVIFNEICPSLTNKF